MAEFMLLKKKFVQFVWSIWLGTGNIPGPVENLHATIITNTSISLEWSPNVEDASGNSTYDNLKKVKNIDFVIQYGKVNNMTLYETVVKMDNVCEIYHTPSILSYIFLSYWII